MWEFQTVLERKHGIHFKDYHELHQWSVENVGEFWEEVWAYTNIVSNLDGVTGSAFAQVSS